MPLLGAHRLRGRADCTRAPGLGLRATGHATGDSSPGAPVRLPERSSSVDAGRIDVHTPAGGEGKWAQEGGRVVCLNDDRPAVAPAHAREARPQRPEHLDVGGSGGQPAHLRRHAGGLLRSIGEAWMCEQQPSQAPDRRVVVSCPPLQFLREEAIDITRRGRLEDVNEAFRAMKAGEVTRTVLMFD